MPTAKVILSLLIVCSVVALNQINNSQNMTVVILPDANIWFEYSSSILVILPHL